MADPATARTPVRRPRVAARLVWAERLARFARSGLRPAQFCAREGVSLPSFYSWKRRLGTALPDPDATPAAGPRLLPVRLTDPGAAVEVVLPAGAVLRLRPGCDLAFVRALTQALGELPC